MHIFDYRLMQKGQLPMQLLNVAATIYTLKTAAQFRAKDFKGTMEKLVEIAKVQSVKSSNAIEGIVTTDERIAAIVNHDSAPANHNEIEIAGYRDALRQIHEHYQDMDFSEQAIRNLHRTMVGAVSSDAGEYKRDDNVILETDSTGNNHVRFVPVSARDTPQAMSQFVLAVSAALADSGLNALILIPSIVLDLLCIHPFRDGNGRLSRLLSLLLLYKAGFDVVRYISFEEQINNSKAYYYDALKQSSAGWPDNRNDYLPFVENFIYTLYLCYKELDRRFAVANSGSVTKTARIEATVLNSLTPLSKSDIASVLPDVSPTTIEAVLHAMLKANRIEKIGSGRATRYRVVT